MTTFQAPYFLAILIILLLLLVIQCVSSMKVQQATTWGYLINGSFNGLIADIISGSVDMSLTPFEFLTVRMDVIDYVVETWYVHTPLTFLHPRRSTLRNNFLRPFTNDLWRMILLVGAVYWALLLLSVLFEQRHEDQTPDATSSAVETGLTTMAALSQQGLEKLGNNLRIVIRNFFRYPCGQRWLVSYFGQISYRFFS